MLTVYLDSRFQRLATKKALKEAVKAGKAITVHSESLFSSEVPDGTHVMVGPSPYNRKWYATVTVKDLALTGVK